MLALFIMEVKMEDKARRLLKGVMMRITIYSILFLIAAIILQVICNTFMCGMFTMELYVIISVVDLRFYLGRLMKLE